MPRVLSDIGKLWLSWLPPQFQNDPDIKASIDVQAREFDRLQAKLDGLTDGFFPQRDSSGSYLSIWESILELSVDPVGYTLAQRQQRDLAFLQKLQRVATGLDFEHTASTFLGASWSYEEHIPGDGTSPPGDTLRVDLPYSASTIHATDAFNLLRQIVPAHIAIEMHYDQGFIIGDSVIGRDVL